LVAILEAKSHSGAEHLAKFAGRRLTIAVLASD
jgi:hypothetical protein